MLCFGKLHLPGRKSDRMPVAASCSGIHSIHRIRISLCPVVSHSIHTFQFPLVRRDKHLRGRIRVTKGAKLVLNQTSKSYITGVETSDITGLTVCGSVISNPVFICIFTLHADNNWLENEMNRYQSTL